ncbi:MAG: hypothetical protein R2867_32685 [Caldilineaceae bacterium]
MRNLRRLLASPMLVVLLGLLSACIVEMRPDHSMLIYVPPPGLPSSASEGRGTIPGTIPSAGGTIPGATDSPLLDLVSATTTALSATVPTNASVPLTGTVTPTNTAIPTSTVIPSVTLTVTATQTVSPTGSATARATDPTGTGTPGATPSGTTPGPTGTVSRTPSPIGTGTRASTPAPTAGATATTRATATMTPSRAATPTSTSQPTATATRTSTPTGGAPAPTATPIPGTVFLGRHSGFAENSNYIVVGEVLNGDSYPVFNVKVIGSFYDNNNNLVAAQESTTDFHQIEPELSSPFKLQVSNGSDNIDHYELTLIWDDVSIVDYEELTILSAEADHEGGEISGELRNEGSVSVQEIVVVVTLYGEEGDVVNVFRGTVDQAVLGANETTRYTIAIPTDLDFDRFEVQAQGALKLF